MIGAAFGNGNCDAIIGTIRAVLPLELGPMAAAGIEISGGEVYMLKNDMEFFRIIYRFFADGTKLKYSAIGIGLLVAFLYFKIFFRDSSGFEEEAENAGKMPIVNRDYDYVETQWSKGKIYVWIGLSVGCGIAAYYQLPQWLPHFFKAP
jgi:hypothetical protein